MTAPAQETLETEVVIVGAGPTGLMIANLLGLYGRKVVLLEGRKELIDYPRAVGMDDETLRLIQTIGLSEQVLPLTGPSHIMRLVNGKGGVILYNDPQVHPFGWPKKNGFNQPLMDAEFLKGLDRFDNVEVCFDHYVERVDEDADGLTVHVAVGGWTGAEALGSSPDEPAAAEQVPTITTRRTIRAKYLVGCEGGKSGTRKRMGVSFDGMSNSTRWLVVDIEHDPLGTPNVWLGADPERSYVSIGLPQGVRRFEFRLRDDEPDGVVTDPAWVHEILKDHVPDPTKLSYIRRRVYTHHGRVASSSAWAASSSPATPPT